MKGEGLKSIAFMEKNSMHNNNKIISLQRTQLAAQLSSLRIKTDAPLS